MTQEDGNRRENSRLEDDRLKLSRRQFLKGASATVAAFGLTGAAAGCSTNTTTGTLSVQPTSTPLPVPLQYPDVPYPPVEPLEAGVLNFFTPHEARTVEALTARILPGTPEDPGAREAEVVYYIDNLLSFNEGFPEVTYRHPPYAQVYEVTPAEGEDQEGQGEAGGGGPAPAQGGQNGDSGGQTPLPTPPSGYQGGPLQPEPTPTLPLEAGPAPTQPAAQQTPAATASPAGETGPSAQATPTADEQQAPAGAAGEAAQYRVVWVPAEEIIRYGYQSILTPREVYRLGITSVDRYAQSVYGADFVDLSEEQQDRIVGDMAEGRATGFDDRVLSAESFFHNLRRHTAEGMFSDPAYGGNRDLVGWNLVGYPGAQRAYTPDQFRDEGFVREPQSLAQMHDFNPGQPVNPHVIVPVTGAGAERRFFEQAPGPHSDQGTGRHDGHR